MRLVIQRVSEGCVIVDGSITGSIGNGLVVFIGIGTLDEEEDARYLCDKLLHLRIFPDEAGKMNRSVEEARGSLLLISQFTLYGDCRRGRRPSFDQAAPPDRALELYHYFVEIAKRSPVRVETGIFQATMQVQLVNEGPVTIWMDSADRSRR